MASISEGVNRVGVWASKFLAFGDSRSQEFLNGHGGGGFLCRTLHICGPINPAPRGQEARGFVEPDSQIKRITFTFLELINAEQSSSSTKTDRAFSEQKFHISPIKAAKPDPRSPQMQVRPSWEVHRGTHTLPPRSSWCFLLGLIFIHFSSL